MNCKITIFKVPYECLQHLHICNMIGQVLGLFEIAATFCHFNFETGKDTLKTKEIIFTHPSCLMSCSLPFVGFYEQNTACFSIFSWLEMVTAHIMCIGQPSVYIRATWLAIIYHQYSNPLKSMAV